MSCCGTCDSKAEGPSTIEWGQQGFKIRQDDSFVVPAASEFAGWKTGYGPECGCGGTSCSGSCGGRGNCGGSCGERSFGAHGSQVPGERVAQAVPGGGEPGGLGMGGIQSEASALSEILTSAHPGWATDTVQINTPALLPPDWVREDLNALSAEGWPWWLPSDSIAGVGTGGDPNLPNIPTTSIDWWLYPWRQTVGGGEDDCNSGNDNCNADADYPAVPLLVSCYAWSLFINVAETDALNCCRKKMMEAQDKSPDYLKHDCGSCIREAPPWTPHGPPEYDCAKCEKRSRVVGKAHNADCFAVPVTDEQLRFILPFLGLGHWAWASPFVHVYVALGIVYPGDTLHVSCICPLDDTGGPYHY